MPYCINCGNQVDENVKFCPNCGAKLNFNINNTDTEVPPPPKRKMQKGVVKSLQDKIPEIGKRINKEIPDLDSLNKTKKVNEQDETIPNKTVSSQSKMSVKWLIVYAIFNFLIYTFYGGEDEVKGIVFFTVITAFMLWFRRNKEKPVNLVLKIILILQAVLTFSVLMTNLQYLENEHSLLASILLAPLTFSILMLIFKGNKS